MLVTCQCSYCSQPLAFDAAEADARLNCPNCGAETRLLSPAVPRAKGEKVGDGDFYVWLDDKAEGPLQSQQLLDLSKDFPDMAWSFAGGSDWMPLSNFQCELDTARRKSRMEQLNARRKELQVHKKELQERKREISAAMAAIRSETRRQSAAAGANWLGLYDSELAADQRRDIRSQKEAALFPLEQQKASIDQQLLQIEQDLLALQRDEPPESV